MALRKIADIRLGDSDYQLAKNGGPYCLTRQVGVDAYGNAYFDRVEVADLHRNDVEHLIDLVGQQTEEINKFRTAVARTEE